MNPPIVDVDTHIEEPRDLWLNRMSAKKWGDNIPHVRMDHEEGREYWHIGDTRIAAGIHSSMVPSDRPDSPRRWTKPFPDLPKTLDDIHPGCYDAAARLEVMDAYGLSVAAIYPNLNFVVASFHAGLADPEFQLECVRVYNDFLLEWISPAPERFIPLACVPYWDVSAAVAEIERCAALGFKGLISTGSPHKAPHNAPFLADRGWDPMWRAAEDAGLSIGFHVGGGDLPAHIGADRLRTEGPHILHARVTTASLLENAISFNDLLLSGVLPRFPDLRFVAVEAGVGWVPFVLESADMNYKKARVWEAHPEFDGLPSEYFRKQVYTTVWFEQVTPFYIERVGADNILFETDFPHSLCLDGDQVKQAITTLFEEISTDARDAILWKNAAKLYDIDVPLGTDESQPQVASR